MGNYLLVGAGCLVIGFFLGFYVSNNLNRNAGYNAGQTQSGPPFQNPPTQVASVKEPTGPMMPDVSETLDQARTQPENFEAQMKAGDMYQKIQNFQKAAGFYDAAAVLKPTEYEKIVRLGNAFFDIRHYEKAETYYLQALEKKPDDIDVRTDLGITFAERQNADYDRAIKELQESLRLNPKHETTLYYLSVVHHRKGDPASAEKFRAQLEQTNPNSPLIGRLKQIIQQK